MNVCEGLVVDFNAPTGSDNCGGSVTVAQTAGPASGTVFPTGNTIVTFTLTDENGNSSTCNFTVTVNSCTGIDNVDTKVLSVIFAPNPARNYSFVSLENAKSDATYTFIMYNSLGQPIIKEQVMNNKLQIDVNSFASGIYFYTVFENEIIVSQQKVVVSK